MGVSPWERVAKYVKPTSSTAQKRTYYIRDAQGNVMAVYTAKVTNNSGTITWDTFYLSEQHLYGSNRLGLAQTNVKLYPGTYKNPHLADSSNYAIFEGWKRYELTNHLGNVLAVVSDRKIGKSTGTYPGPALWYEADVLSTQQYYPFGMLMPGRQYAVGSYDYRYGFNGKEGDDEVKGDDNQQDYGMRIYDPRVGRFLSVDPITKQYPELTPYQFASNTPIQAIDLDGLEQYYAAYGKFLGKSGTSPEIRIIADYKIWDIAQNNLSSEKNDHSWLRDYSRTAFKADKENEHEKKIFQEWARTYKPIVNDEKVKKEYVMQTFTKTLIDADGNSFDVMMRGSTEKYYTTTNTGGGRSHAEESRLFIGLIDLEKYFGWKRTSSIHSHPGGYSEFSNEWEGRNSFANDSDIPHSIKTNQRVALINSVSTYIMMFDPEKYSKIYPKGLDGNKTDHEAASKKATNLEYAPIYENKN
jgi:RHS repeat-associated protein